MTCLLVLAKAPVVGKAKTRLGAEVGERRAARLAAAAFLDTLDAVLSTPDTLPVVAMTGSLAEAEMRGELTEALARCTVIPQRGADLAERLVNAHADVVRIGLSVLQIGMDTPQVTPDLLVESIDRLHEPGVDAVLGPAVDGGWWALGLRSPADAKVLRDVPMSRSDTGERTREALLAVGLNVRPLPELSDVDTLAEATRVARLAPGGRFAAEVSG